MRGWLVRTNDVTRVLSIAAIGAMTSASAWGCGGGAAEPVAEETTGAEEETPRTTFSGTWNGERFDAQWVALGWQWPGGWTVFLSDRPPNEGDVGLPVDANYVELRFGDTSQPVATEAGQTMTPFVTVAPNADGSTTPYEGEATSMVSLTDVSMTGSYDPSGSTPQTVGTATLELDASFGADASHAAGNLRGRGSIPIVFLGAPHVACRDAQPAPTDYTWAEAPNLRQVPSGPVHGNVRGRAFTPASIFFERRTTNGEEEWAMLMSTETNIGFPGVEHETLTIRFDRAPRRGRSTRAMASGGGYWQACVGLGTTSWNADNAYALEITRWQVSRCTPPAEGGGPAHLGTASGRIIVAYRGFEEGQNSWVAGTFTNVPIVTPSCD